MHHACQVWCCLEHCGECVLRMFDELVTVDSSHTWLPYELAVDVVLLDQLGQCEIVPVLEVSDARILRMLEEERLTVSAVLSSIVSGVQQGDMHTHTTRCTPAGLPCLKHEHVDFFIMVVS